MNLQCTVLQRALSPLSLTAESHLLLFLQYSPTKPYTREPLHTNIWQTPIWLNAHTKSRQFTLVATKIALFWSPLFTHYFVCSPGLTSRQQLNVFSAAACSQFISEQYSNMTTSKDSWDLKLYLALLGGSYCKTQWTSGMSMPRAITSVQTKMPLGRRKSIFSLNCHLRRASVPHSCVFCICTEERGTKCFKTFGFWKETKYYKVVAAFTKNIST